MVTFLNERSVEEYGDLRASLTFFFRASQELSTGGVSLRKDSAFFGSAWFRQRFNSISIPNDEKAVLRELAFGSKFANCWRAERVSDEAEIYVCLNVGEEMADGSLCEAAEVSFHANHNPVTVLSAAGSVFAGKDQLDLLKVQSDQVALLANASSIEEIVRWLASDRGHYNPASNAAPHDFQTVLVKDPIRFRRTMRRERRFRRLIFEEISTSYLYYVDQGHPGPSAHLEVFSPVGEHLGTADINRGELNVEKRVNGRTLRE